MNPPFVPWALVVAATSPADHDVVTGDLEEEYTFRFRSAGRRIADRWYWSQALRSLPALLSYSRSRRTLRASAATGVIVVIILIAMLASKDLIDRILFAIYPGGIVRWLYFSLDWTDAAIFGAALAQFAGHPVRLALFASTFLVTGFALPVVLGISPALGPPRAGILLLGTIPAMIAGAVAYQIVRRRFSAP